MLLILAFLSGFLIGSYAMAWFFQRAFTDVLREMERQRRQPVNRVRQFWN